MKIVKWNKSTILFPFLRCWACAWAMKLCVYRRIHRWNARWGITQTIDSSRSFSTLHWHAPHILWAFLRRCDMLSEAFHVLLMWSTEHGVSMLENPWYWTRDWVLMLLRCNFTSIGQFTLNFSRLLNLQPAQTLQLHVSAQHFSFLFRFEDNTAKWNEAVALSSWNITLNIGGPPARSSRERKKCSKVFEAARERETGREKA